MTAYTFRILLNLLLIASGILTLYSIWFAFVALVGFKKQKNQPATAPTTRFAVVVAARNEEAVIGQLVDSLCAQNYPKYLYDIIVAPNNCTDNTAGVALQHGAAIFSPKGKITGKGEVLRQISAQLMQSKQYDAMCVLDADNLAHPDFLQSMNNAYNSGIEAAQGFRDSKNPTDTAISTCYSVGYWMTNRFYNAGRAAMGLSALINGSGFMLSVDLLRRLGGWHTSTLTEDYEITAQCVMQGQRVHYVPQAVIYDEQPLTFAESWKQRRRWATGSIQGMQLHFENLLRYAFKKGSFTALDLAATYITPIIQLVGILLSSATMLLNIYGIIEFQFLPVAEFVSMLALGLCLAFAAGSLLAAFVFLHNRQNLHGAEKGVLFFMLFVLSCVPINIISLFKQQKTWEPIAHTKAVSFQELS